MHSLGDRDGADRPDALQLLQEACEGRDVHGRNGVRLRVAKYLAKNGMRVSVANGSAEMRQQMRVAVIDLVVLDIMMPGKDALSLCRQLRQTSDIPIVLLTAV